MKLIKESYKKILIIGFMIIAFICGILYLSYMDDNQYDKDLSTPMKDIILKQIPTDEGFL